MDLENKSIPIIEEIEKLQQIQSKYYLEARDVTLDTVDKIYIFEINQLYFSNKMNIGSKLRLYISKVWNFIFNDPRFANTEGGIFPAILGTVLLVFLMTIMVVPMGVMTALFLCEYTKNNQIIRLIRAAIYNLAGIPSIIFGMFGLGLFIYGIGGSLDQLFFSDHLPQPTFGTGGIFWSALTMALLTLPVVIVASEDGFRVVSREYKEGAYALGANKWQMVSGIMLPRALPAILTGVILAIGRAAGEVAPLMLTGVVKFAQEPLLDNTFPFIHLNAKFMHLGFHIYDLGYQSPNVEAAKPVMFATALLLISIVIVLNLFAFYVRNHYRERYGLSDE